MRASLLVITITLLACHRESPPAPGQEIQASSLPRIKVTGVAKMLFTFARPDGSFETVEQMDKVPQERRGWVRVVDLRIKPSRRMDHELVYVADLREKRKDSTYPYVVLPRTTFESAAVNRAHSGATSRPAAGGSAAVVLYSTSWCPACRTARDYLTKHRIPFVEKDIEQDREAAAELLQKARAAGISASGVPVLEVRGTLMQGFDPRKLNTLLGDAK